MRVCLLFLIALAGCSSREPLVMPIEVAVPVALPCPTTPVPKPAFALNAVTVKDSLTTKTRAALVELEQRKAYEVELEARILACRL